MPLAFESLSHGTVAFGFFNIESDMLLLDRYFFFSTEFCDHMNTIARCGPKEPLRFPWQVYHIGDPARTGDLMGAIHGVRFTGFIGELYKTYPFPGNESEFKQNPDGVRTRGLVEAMISKYAERSEVMFEMDQFQDEASIGSYRFGRSGFQALVRYVWQGGYPRWRNEQRPDYVLDMKDRIHASRCLLFEGLTLSL